MTFFVAKAALPLLTAILLVSTSTGAQESEPDFSIFDYDLESTDWILAALADPDSVQDTDAVYLLSRCSHISVSAERCVSQNRKTLQVYSQEMADIFQTIEIGYSPFSGAPEVVFARIISPNGDVKVVEPSDLIDTADGSDDSDAGDDRKLVIPFAGLKVGDALDFVYRMPRVSMLGDGWSIRFLFGEALPVKREILEIHIPEETEANLFRKAEPEGDAYSYDETNRIHRWTMTDEEAFMREELCPALTFRYPWIGLSTFGTWDAAGETYQRVFWEKIEVTPEISELAEKLTEGLDGDYERASALYAYTNEDIGSISVELGSGRLIPTSAAEVLRRSYGDCKDKTALLVALCLAADIKAEPALVATRPGSTVRSDFPELGSFTHMIVRLPDIRGGTFCDPSMGDSCLDYLPVSVEGTLSLIVPAEGKGKLMSIPAASAEDHGFSLEIDIRPRSNNMTEIRLEGQYRGLLAQYMTEGLAVADTAWAGTVVDRVLAYGLWGSCKRNSWHLESDDCDRATLTATYVDTSWAPEQGMTVTFSCRNEVADPFITFPSSEGRELDVELDFPFRNQVVIRFHDAAGWEASSRVRQFKVKGPFYKGRIQRDVRESDGSRFVEVRQEFEVRRQDIELEEYREFRKDWVRFMGGVYQRYRYLRGLDEERVTQLVQYAEEHSDDFAFLMQAASQILGSDMGGEEETGLRRRRIARDILQPVLDHPEAGAMPLLAYAGIEAHEGRYLMADSLATLAVEREESNIYALLGAFLYKDEVDDLDGKIAILRGLASSLGSEELLMGLATALYAKELDDEARDIEERLSILHAPVDSTALIMGRYQGYVQSDRYALAGEEFQAIAEDLPVTYRQAVRAEVLMGLDRHSEAADTLEVANREAPGDPTISNNLAWALAMAGRDLERAEELVHTAMALVRDETGSKNTLGVIYMGQGRWDEAHGIFEDLLASDDRPSSQIANLHFLALCEYWDGDDDKAIGAWNKALGMPGSPTWKRRIRRSLDLADAGQLRERLEAWDMGAQGTVAEEVR